MAGVYPIIKMLHLKETEEDVAEQVVRLVDLLKRDEGSETERDGDEYWVASGKEGGEAEEEEEEDSDDDQIVEIVPL